tara:strand:- start:1876 stop:2064 length:189 start_codon:yes stop_codon:yes gene_type:complete
VKKVARKMRGWGRREKLVREAAHSHHEWRREEKNLRRTVSGISRLLAAIFIEQLRVARPSAL